jgi:multidrug resistance efflux pump
LPKSILFFLILSLEAVGCRPHADRSHVDASGTLEMTEVYLSPNVPGKISTLGPREGDHVTAGQRVGTLDRYEQAQRDYDRAKKLISAGGSTRQQVEHAELALQDQQLISPIDGVILLRVSEPGEVIAPGTPALVIGNPKDVWIKVYIPEGDIGRVELGQRAEIHVDAFPDRAFAGKITFISPRAEFTPKNIQTKEERVTQMFAVKITLDAPEGLLKPGMPADCTLTTAHG